MTRDSELAALDQLLLERSVRRGDFVLASGRRSSFYVDARLTTMSAQGLVLIGRVGLQAIRTKGWTPDAVGGLTMGADPVAYAIAAASVQSPPQVQAFQCPQGGEGTRYRATHRRELRRR
jgi:orotate phosphoribosyltransferase